MTKPPELPPVLVADIGSIENGNFGWAGSESVPDGDPTRIEDFAEAGLASLIRHQSLCLGFECPLFIPAFDVDGPEGVGRGREGEGNRAWSAGAGAFSLTTGLAQTLWIFHRLRDRLAADGLPAVFFDWSDFRKAVAPKLFIWEAFVSGAAKGEEHAIDARSALTAFQRLVAEEENPTSAIDEPEVFSLVAAILLRTGWPISHDLLSRPNLVVRAR